MFVSCHFYPLPSGAVYITCLTAIISPVLAFIARNIRPCVPLPISSPQSHLNAAWSSVLWPVKLCIKLTVSGRCCRYFVNFATPGKSDASRTGSYDRPVQIVRRKEVFQAAVNVFWRSREDAAPQSNRSF